MMKLADYFTERDMAMCSLANPERLGKIAGKTFITYICFYVVFDDIDIKG